MTTATRNSGSPPPTIDVQNLPFPPSFQDLKETIQAASRGRTKKKGEESDFSAAVRETYERRGYELASATYYYWGSLVDSSNVDCLLTSEKQCVLIDARPKMLGGRQRSRFALAVNDGGIKYYSVKCAANELIIDGAARKLGKYITEEHLEPLPRQYIWREDQISPPLDVKEASSDALYELGKVQRRRLLFPAGKSIQVLSIVASELRPEERNVIISDLAKYKDFGCVNIQRLWGSMVTDTQITVLLEDTATGTLSDYVTSETRSSGELLKFARQMATAVDFFDRTKFVHKKLSIDVCLVTVDATLKMIVFGLSTGLVPKRIYVDDAERCRWMPWECLKGTDGEPEPYDQTAMIWTLATMVWSMFHRAAIPFENESGPEIRSREYRKNYTLDVMEELLPNGLLELLQACWAERRKRPTCRDVLKTIKKLEHREQRP